MLRTEIRTKEILLIFGLCISTVVPYTEHQTLILSGVERILRTNNPGTISLLNENSFPILAGSFGRTLRSHVAAVEYGAGRIIAHSHTDSLLQANMPSGYDNYQLLINSINWLGKNGTGKIGLYPDWRTRQNILSELGYETQVLSANDFNNPTYLEQFYVIIIGGNVNETSVREYVRSGVGGLMIAATPWNHNANNMESFWGNIILRDTGLFYLGSYGSYGTMDCNNQGGGCFNASTEFLKDTHSVHVWNALKQFNSNQTHLPRDRTEQVMQILRDRLLYTPRDDIFNRDINAELKRLPTFVPTATNPVTAENEKHFLIIHRYLCEFLIIIVGLTSDIPPHPSALSFPGDVVTSSGQRLSHLIEIDAMLPSWTENLSVDEIIDFDTRDTKIYENGDESELQIPSDVIEVNTRGTAWYSTGLYARPGDEIHIQVLNATNWGFDLDVQIGAHTDDLEPLSSWRRCPRIVFRNTIRNNRSSIANPFGGPIYIVLNNYNDNVMLQLSITGGIRSPTYFMGETLLSQWRNEIRSSAAPWGELIGKNLIILTQNQYLSQMDDPEAIIDFWDRVLDAISDLGAMPRERVKSERFVADVQISDGFMHSGYPIMYHLFDQDKPLGISEFRGEPYRLWGFLHELGHNHQKTDWTFSGTGEVTCNIFVLYVMHNILLAPTNKTHPDLSDAYVAQTLRQYINDGKRFSDWKSKPFLALLTYIQLQEYFGWSAYQRVFSNYNQLTGDERPRNDQEKMDLWMIMFSRVVEENLTPFFTSWGFPISPEAEYYVRDLPYTNLRIADQW